MKKYLAHDGINNEYESFETIEEAREWLEDIFLSKEDGYHPDLNLCCIYELKEKVDYTITDSKQNYKYIDEEDIPEDDNESEAWPYDNEFDEIWKHKFIDVNKKQ